MSSSSAGSLDNASKEPLDLPLGSRDSNSRTGMEEEHRTTGPSGSKGTRTQHSTTTSGDLDGAEAGKQQSMATRLGASASGLMSDVFGSSSVNGFLPGFAAGATDRSKGQSSSSSSGPSESSTAVQNSKNRPDGGIGSNHAPIHPVSFRSSPTSTRSLEKQAQSDFDEFMFNGEGPSAANDVMNEIYDLQRSTHIEHGQLSEGASYTSTKEDQLPTIGTQSSTSAFHRGDGAAVVSLLSDPEFSIDDPSAYFDMYDHQMAATDPLISRLTSQELDQLIRIKAQLPQPPIHRVPAPTNPLNLLPSFEQSSSLTNGRSGSNTSTTLHPEESYTYLTPDTTSTWSYDKTSSGESSEGVEAHVKQWLNVLNRYQDDVWGDLLPLVQDARTEVAEAINSESNELQEGPAVRRLAMVFAHLKASPASVKAISVP